MAYSQKQFIKNAKIFFTPCQIRFCARIAFRWIREPDRFLVRNAPIRYQIPPILACIRTLSSRLWPRWRLAVVRLREGNQGIQTAIAGRIACGPGGNSGYRPSGRSDRRFRNGPVWRPCNPSAAFDRDRRNKISARSNCWNDIRDRNRTYRAIADQITDRLGVNPAAKPSVICAAAVCRIDRHDDSAKTCARITRVKNVRPPIAISSRSILKYHRDAKGAYIASHLATVHGKGFHRDG